MFEQHPVPQQISSYSFKLVGDMTLKQFFQLAGGAVIGLIVYSLPLPGFFKWPLIAIAVIAGAAFAFLPIQDRPLEQWLVAFFRSIYRPTLFVWQKPAQPAQYFSLDTTGAPPLPVDDGSIQDTTHDTHTQNLETNEKNFLNRISTIAKGGTLPVVPAPASVAPTQPPAQTPKPAAVQTEIVDEAIKIPQTKPVEVEHSAEPVPQPKSAQSVATSPVQTAAIGQTLSGNLNVAAAAQAQFSPEAAPPSPPGQPNLVVGQVMDLKGRIVEGAILEISDSGGRPVRALKTNRAGHFLIVTPLPNGEYRIVIEKDDLQFEPITFKAAGEVIAPIAIKAKNELPEAEERAVWTV